MTRKQLLIKVKKCSSIQQVQTVVDKYNKTHKSGYSVFSRNGGNTAEVRFDSLTGSEPAGSGTAVNF